jgi:DNA-binding CsgD family transcriptional regulator
MLHEIILSVTALLSIASGVWSILFINKLSENFKLNYLSTFLYYQILLFVFGVYGLLGIAIIDEILKTLEATTGMVETIINFLPFLGIPFLIAAWYMLIKLSAELTHKKISSLATIIYFTIMLMLMLGSGIITFFLFQSYPDKAIELAYNSKIILIAIDLLIFSIALYYLYFYGSKIKNRSTRKMVLTFAHINLFVKILLSILFYYAARDSISGALYLLLFFSCNIPAMLYLDYYLNIHHLKNAENENHIPFIQFIRDYNLTKREWEITERICEGMTNKEISDKLFISLQTVKDHCYRIYKKTGVRNRVELVNLVSPIRK